MFKKLLKRKKKDNRRSDDYVQTIPVNNDATNMMINQMNLINATAISSDNACSSSYSNDNSYSDSCSSYSNDNSYSDSCSSSSSSCSSSWD